MKLLDIKKIIYKIHTLYEGDKEVTIDLENGDTLVDNIVSVELDSRVSYEHISTERIVNPDIDFSKLKNILAKSKSKRYLMLWVNVKSGKRSYLVGTRDLDGTIEVNPIILDITYIGYDGEVKKYSY